MNVVPLRRLFRVVNGGTPTADAENWGGDVPWATPVDLARVNGRVLTNTDRTLSVHGLRSGSRVVTRRSLLVSTRAPIGYVAEIPSGTAFNQGCRALEPLVSVDLRFFRYQLSATSARLASLGQGSTFVELSGNDLAGVPIVVPSVDAQVTISDHLDRETARIDALLDARQRQLDLFDELFAARHDRLFTDLNGWCVPLGRFVRSIGQGVSPQAEDRPVELGEWGVLKLSAVKSGAFVPSEHKALPLGFDPNPSVVPRVGDLLVTRANTPELVGDACAVTTAPERLILSDLIYVLRLSDRLDARFAAEALLSRAARLQFSSSARGTSQSMVKLRGEDVKAVEIPVPPIEDQLTAVDVLNASRIHYGRLADAVRKSVALLRERRQALITAAVTGQLPIPVPA